MNDAVTLFIRKVEMYRPWGPPASYREGHHEGIWRGSRKGLGLVDLHAGQVGDGVEVDALEVAPVGDRGELPPPVQRQ